MNTKRTLIIAVIFLLAGGFYYFFELKHKPKIKEQKVRESSIIPIEEKDATRLVFKRFEPNMPEEEFVFEKNGDQWFLKKPVEAKADNESIINFVRSLVTAVVEEEVEEENPDLSKYGLEKPYYILTVSDGKNEKTIHIGDGTIDMKSFFTRHSDEDRVFLMSSGMRYNLIKPLIEFRDKSVVEVELQDVARAVLHTPEEMFVFEKKDKNWTVTEPIIPRPGNREIEGFIKAIVTLKTKEFFEDTPANREIFGIDKSDFWIELYSKKSEKPILIRIGNNDTTRKLLYVAVEGSRDIFGLNLFDEKNLYKEPNDFIRKSLLEAENDEISIFTAVIEGNEYVFKKEAVDKNKDKTAEGDFVWKLISPLEKTVNPAQIRMVLSSITNMYVKSGFFPDKNPDHYGLDHPGIILKGQREDTKNLFTVKIGGEAGDYPEKGFVYAQVEGEDPILLLNSESIRKLKEDVLKQTIPGDEEKAETHSPAHNESEE